MELRIAALYDVHGNLPALEAVLADAERERVDLVVFGGDLIWGAWPSETLELALSLGDRARFIRGNTDRSALTGTGESDVWTQQRLTPAQQSLVLAWPETLALDGALYCHATPRSDTEIVLPTSTEERWAEVLAGVDEEVVVCGHTHLQDDEVRAGHRVVNSGSVGHPTDRATAWWAMLGPDVELRTSDYDTAATAAAMRERGFPLKVFADELLEPVTRAHVLDKLAEHA